MVSVTIPWTMMPSFTQARAAGSNQAGGSNSWSHAAVPLSQVDDIRKANVEARELEAYATWCLEAGEYN
jgi:hypothetical protein